MKEILIVEDSKSEQMLLSGLLKTLGANVVAVDTGELAVKWLKDNIPDLIFLDIIMPKMSGYDLCRAIREDKRLEKVPIIFCSTKNEDFDKFWALRQGGNDYVTKPYLPNDLVEKAKSYLK